jgi:peptidoglycan hydrolase-like protein with peptidoglycan-binding domain
MFISALLVIGVGVLALLTPQSAEAATANVVCSKEQHQQVWSGIKPMVPISSAGGTDCYLQQQTQSAAVVALQNALAFTDYNLCPKLGKINWTYAGLLNGGSGALAANNWGIDGKFGTNTYKALYRFQVDKKLVYKDGKFGNESRGQLRFGERDIRSNGYKYQVKGVERSNGGTWLGYGTSAAYAWNC